MTPGEAIAFVREHGVVLESVKGVVPSLAAAIAGEPIHGSWWSHPRSHQIFASTRAVRESSEVLVCRLLGGKVTFVHRERWPALVRCASHFPPEHLAKIGRRILTLALRGGAAALHGTENPQQSHVRSSRLQRV